MSTKQLVQTNPYLKELEILLKPIRNIQIVGYASDTHGHLHTKCQKELLPWYYIKYAFEKCDQDEIYTTFFKQYEKSEENNFYSDYRYYDVELFNSLFKIKLKPVNRRLQLDKLIKKCGKNNCHFEFNDDSTQCYFKYLLKAGGVSVGLSPLSKEFINEFESKAINL